MPRRARHAQATENGHLAERPEARAKLSRLRAQLAAVRRAIEHRPTTLAEMRTALDVPPMEVGDGGDTTRMILM